MYENDRSLHESCPMAGWLAQFPKNRPLLAEKQKINKAKANKRPSNSRGLAESHERIFGEELHSSSVAKWTHTHLRMVTSPFSCCTSWQVKNKEQDCLWFLSWILERELKHRSLAWTKVADRHIYYPRQILKGTVHPCRRHYLNVPSDCFNPGRQTTT